LSVAPCTPTFGYVASLIETDGKISLTVSQPAAYRKNDGSWVETYSMSTLRIDCVEISAVERLELARDVAVLILSDMANPLQPQAKTLKILRDADGRPIRRQ